MSEPAAPRQELLKIQCATRLFESLYPRLVLGVPWIHRALIRVLLPDVDLPVELFGSRLQINKRKEAGYWRAHRVARSSPVLWNESGALVSLALILAPGDTFVDVGANVGLFSSSLAPYRHLPPPVRFYPFQPNPTTPAPLPPPVLP